MPTLSTHMHVQTRKQTRKMYFRLLCNVSVKWVICDSLITALLAIGVKESTRFNNIFTCINLFVIAYVIICGLFKAKIQNWNLSHDEVSWLALEMKICVPYISKIFFSLLVKYTFFYLELWSYILCITKPAIYSSPLTKLTRDNDANPVLFSPLLSIHVLEKEYQNTCIGVCWLSTKII